MKKSNCLYRNKKYVLMLFCLKDVLFPIGKKICSYVLMSKINKICSICINTK